MPRALASLAPSHLADRDAVSQALASIRGIGDLGFTVAADTSAEERLFDTLAARYASLPGGSEVATARQTRVLFPTINP